MDTCLHKNENEAYLVFVVNGVPQTGLPIYCQARASFVDSSVT